MDKTGDHSSAKYEKMPSTTHSILEEPVDHSVIAKSILEDPDLPSASFASHSTAPAGIEHSPETAPLQRARRETRVRKNFAEDDDDDFEDDGYSSGHDYTKPARKIQRTAVGEIGMSREESNVSYAQDMAGRKCQYCGATETPQWRRGPGGKRTLCNACGVKWSSGRLHIPKNMIPPPPQAPVQNTSETESHHNSSDPASGFEDVEVGSPAWKLQLEVARLKSKLREAEKSQKKLSRLLIEGQAADREIDRCYRKILSGAKLALPKVYSQKH
ncbi:hypothetical protein HDV03_000285, partial [Kappamyces sp. JEL0829]